jgi:flagellar biosynthetic protein FliO
VTEHKKKIIAFLAVVAVVGGVVLLCPAQSFAGKSAKSDNSRSLFTKDPNFSESSSGTLSTRELFIKMMLSVLLVVVLGAGAIYVSRKFGAKIGNLSGKEIRIIETAHLGPRKAVHLLKIGSQQILIGSTNESITKLADVTGTLTETELSK